MKLRERKKAGAAKRPSVLPAVNPEKKERLIKLFNRYSLLFHALLACSLCFYIEWVSRHSFGAAVDFLFDRSWVFLYNSLIIFVSFLAVYFFKRRFLVRVLLSGFWFFLGTINGCLLLKRVTPFGYTDLKLIKDLLAMQNNYFSKSEEILVICIVALFVVFNLWLWKKGPKFKGKPRYFGSLVLLASCLFAIPVLTQAGLKSHLLTDYFGNIAQGYKNYGFVYGFSTSVVDRGMSKPADYTEETVKAIQSEVDVPETSVKEGEEPNIIVVLLESFLDPDEINFLNYSKDPAPNFHKLSEAYSSGHFIVPVVGAGTANTEFEVLTGMSLRYFGTGEYPYKTVLKTKSCESIADSLGSLGYGTHVVHNNGGNFYSRANAFSKMGFDTFTSKEMMNITEYTPLGTWAKDAILTSEVEKALDSTPDTSDLVYTITVQPHGDYPTEKVIEDPAIRVTGAETEGQNNAWEYYINELHETDQFIGDLIDMLNKRDEKTIVAFFGDHIPTMGLEETDLKTGDLFKTKYITWNNFGLEKEDADLTAYQFLADITAKAGIHEGSIFTYHQSQMDKNLTETPEYLTNLEQLQYDLLYGSRYCYDGIEKYPASNLEMGVADIVVTDVANSFNDRMVVKGENFTPWSKVYVNGEKVTTYYINGTQLWISSDAIKEGDSVVVNQMGSKSTIFRSSNSYSYYN